MNLTGNTIFITGGGSGIGRGLAEAFHKLGNQVIISGRRKAALEETIQANPGMRAFELDIEDPASIASVAAQVLAEFPALNVLINNAGIMRIDDASSAVDEAVLVSTVTTNLFGPIRMTSAFIEHLKAQPSATIFNVTSGLAFAPLAATSVYCATKAAVHSFTLSQRYRLKDTSVRVREIAPPYVQTDLLGGANDPRAMKLDEFIAETMQLIGGDEDEVLVERVRPLRNAAGPEEGAFISRFNEQMAH